MALGIVLFTLVLSTSHAALEGQQPQSDHQPRYHFSCPSELEDNGITYTGVFLRDYRLERELNINSYSVHYTCVWVAGPGESYETNMWALFPAEGDRWRKWTATNGTTLRIRIDNTVCLKPTLTEDEFLGGDIWMLNPNTNNSCLEVPSLLVFTSYQLLAAEKEALEAREKLLMRLVAKDSFTDVILVVFGIDLVLLNVGLFVAAGVFIRMWYHAQSARVDKILVKLHNLG